MRKTAGLAIFMLVVLSILMAGCNKEQQQKAQAQSEVVQDALEEQQPEPVETQKEEQDQEEPKQEEDPKGFPEGEFSLSSTLADIETLLPQMDYIIGENAPSADVVTVANMKTLYISRDIDSGDAKLTNEVDDYKDSYIIVGSPCDNPAAAALFAKEIEAKGDCRIFPEGEARILMKAVTNNDIIIYVGGNTPAETAKAAEVFMYPTQYGLSGTEVRVTGSREEPVVGVIR